MQIPNWVMNITKKCRSQTEFMYKIKRQHFIAHIWVTKMKSISQGESLNAVQKVSLLFNWDILVYSWAYDIYLLGKDGGREEAGY